jgi:hypothetical protein
MNASRRIFVNLPKASAGARILCGLSAAALLAGCVGDPIASAKVDPSSPIAPEVKKLATQNTDYPSFNEIPPKPNDLLPPRIYGDRAAALKIARSELDDATAPQSWTLNDTDTFANQARRDAGPDFSAPAASDTEAFAASARKRATPPPLAKH